MPIPTLTSCPIYAMVHKTAAQLSVAVAICQHGDQWLLAMMARWNLQAQTMNSLCGGSNSVGGLLTSCPVWVVSQNIWLATICWTRWRWTKQSISPGPYSENHVNTSSFNDTNFLIERNKRNLYAVLIMHSFLGFFSNWHWALSTILSNGWQ